MSDFHSLYTQHERIRQRSELVRAEGEDVGSQTDGTDQAAEAELPGPSIQKVVQRGSFDKPATEGSREWTAA